MRHLLKETENELVDVNQCFKKRATLSSQLASRDEAEGYNFSELDESTCMRRGS